ncbi:MAG: hypothetical protein HZA46_19715 [Planctomycetales bacterium]|nr:hypothetical protein [Planctomycetales bacterium]
MAFPDDRDRELKDRTFETQCLADDLLTWMGEHGSARKANGVGEIRTDEEFQLLTLRRRAGSLHRSSRVPVAAAVYGPSQTGKSLFVGRVLQPQDPNFSPLGRDENAGPPAYYPKLSFVLDLNPSCGQAEATALVSRFTTKDRFDEEASKLKKYAVLVRGLSRSELLRVLARGFRSEIVLPTKEDLRDASQRDTGYSRETWLWGDTEIEDLFMKVSARAEGTTVDREWRMDLLDVFTYLKRNYSQSYLAEEAWVNGLLSRYPLTTAGYVEVAAHLCWAAWPELTALFQEIGSFLDKMRQGGREGMLVHWAAVRFLLDSQQKPVHVSPDSQCFPKVAWTDIVDKVEDGWYVLDYQPGQGPPREKQTIIQSALMEMVLPVLPDRLNPEWREVIANADFLDIPGMIASGASATKGLHTDAKSAEAQMSIVKRGKVFYLFDRYIEELQAQTLLLLVRGGNVQVKGYISNYVEKWGETRYGKPVWPTRVQERPPSLFLGMTGIDDQFAKPGLYPDKELYEHRLREICEMLGNVMTDFGGPAQKFTNVYPIRYPGTWDYDQAGRELQGKDKWDLAEQEFMASKKVQEHVDDAARKWEAAMRDGDGGASLLAAAFCQVLSSRRKQDELERSLNETHQQLVNLAQSWAVDPNTNLDRERRIGVAKEVLNWFTREPQFVYRRVRALEDSLCFRGGDVLPIADFADINPSERDNPLPLEKRLPVALHAFLREWGTSWAPNRWHDYTSEHRDAGRWLEPDSIAALTRYLVDYLTSDEVFSRLCQRVLQVANLRVANQADRRFARRKFVRLILNDYVMNPGDTVAPVDGAEAAKAAPSPAASSGEKTTNGSGNESYGLMAAFVHRWQTRLPAVLAAGAGNKVNIPVGNDKLVELLKGYV